MCDLHFKFEEGRTKTAVAIANEVLWADRQTDRLTLQVVLYSVQCHALHWTENETNFYFLHEILWTCRANPCNIADEVNI